MKKTLLAMMLGTASIGVASAAELTISVTNLTHGSHFTPLFIAAHMPGDHVFQISTTASASLAAMAEGGDTAGLVTDLTNLNADITNNPGPDTTGGPNFSTPGQTISFDMTTQAANTNLSVVAMILPTNDGFIGLDSVMIPTEVGTHTFFLNGYDAGTEVNDEIINGGGAPGVPGIPADPLEANGTGATGVTTTENNVMVHIHRGAIGDTDAAGGVSDLDSRVHRWLNPVARVVIEVK